jgi:trigger factor
MSAGSPKFTLEEQAVEAVLAKAKVSEKATSFNELMNQQA